MRLHFVSSSFVQIVYCMGWPRLPSQCAVFTEIGDTRYSLKTHLGLHIKCPLFMPDFNKNSSMLTDFSKHSQYKLSRKYIQWKPSFFLFGHTDVTKMIGVFTLFANTPKIVTSLLCTQPSAGSEMKPVLVCFCLSPIEVEEAHRKWVEEARRETRNIVNCYTGHGCYLTN